MRELQTAGRFAAWKGSPADENWFTLSVSMFDVAA
jgi:hypothetical protein